MPEDVATGGVGTPEGCPGQNMLFPWASAEIPSSHLLAGTAGNIRAFVWEAKGVKEGLQNLLGNSAQQAQQTLVLVRDRPGPGR